MVAIEYLVAGDYLARVASHPAHGGNQAGFRPAPNFVVATIIANGIDKVIPLQLVGVRFLARTTPDNGIIGEILAAEHSGPGWRMSRMGDDRRTTGAVCVTGKFIMAAGNISAFEYKLTAIRESVFRGIMIEVLVDIIFPVEPTAGPLGFYRPGIFHPAAFIDVMDQEIAEAATASPEESMEPANLILKFANVIGFWSCKGSADRSSHAVGAKQSEIANLAIFDAIDKFLANTAMPAHQTDSHLQIMSFRFGGELEHSPGGGAIDGDWLFHEDIEAFFNCIGKVDPAKSRWGGEDDHITWTKTIHRPPVGIEADKFSFLRDVQLTFMGAV